MESLVKLVLFLAAYQCASADLETPNGIFKTNCFSDHNNGECEDSRVKICHDFYACDLVVEFQTPIKRIGFIDDEILVAEGYSTYWIDDRKMEAKKVKKVIPPLNEYVDKVGNKYYSGEGTTYVSHKESGREIEIITTGEYSFNQLALDKEANLLFILTFTSGNKENREGKLFGVVLDPLNIVDYKIQAEMVKGDYNITALAVAGGVERLLLGIKSEKGGKLVRLSRQQEDPCVVLKSPQNEIINVIKNTEKKLLEIFEENLIALNVRNSAKDKDKENLKILEEQNASCQVQLQEVRSSLEIFTSRISSYSESVSVSNSVLFQSSSDGSATSVSSEVSTRSNETENHHHHHEKECLPVVDVKFMKNRIQQLQEREETLLERIRKYETDLNDILRVRVESRSTGNTSDFRDQITFTV